MFYKNSHKNYVTKPVPMERVFNTKYFDVRLETKHLMVPELWYNGSNGLAIF